jgi:hypothetical protein
MLSSAASKIRLKFRSIYKDAWEYDNLGRLQLGTKTRLQTMDSFMCNGFPWAFRLELFSLFTGGLG